MFWLANLRHTHTNSWYKQRSTQCTERSATNENDNARAERAETIREAARQLFRTAAEAELCACHTSDSCRAPTKCHDAAGRMRASDGVQQATKLARNFN